MTTPKKKRPGPNTREPLAVAIGPVATTIAFAWYDRSSWEELRALAADPQVLDDSFEAWLFSAESSLAQLTASGTTVVKLRLDVSAAAAWASEQGRSFDSAARAAYIAITAREKASQ